MVDRKPDFFLIGAPKCGTTALSEYLREHPDICFSRPKEPYHFCTDLPGYWPGWTDQEYLDRCFGHCGPEARAVGEGSVFYLLSRDAVPQILKFEPNSRFVVMLRNPVDLAHSFHSQLRYNYSEDVPDFETAWRLQDRRRRGEAIPRACREARLLQYREVAAVGSQLRRLMGHVPDERTKVIFFDDFAAGTGAVYRDVLRFLDVNDDGRREFPRIGAGEVHRVRALARVTQRPPGFVVPLLRMIKRKTGIGQLGVLSRLRDWNTRSERRPALSTTFRRELIAEFEDEIRMVEEICDRHLEHWRDPERLGRGSSPS